MLILTRKPTERIFINGQEVIIEILGYQGDKVRLGITAPEKTIINDKLPNKKPKTSIFYKLTRARRVR